MDNDNRKYSVYKHTAPNGKCYIGITKQKPKSRWGKNGNGYKHNQYFMNAINKYGWDNFVHEVLFEGLSLEEAEKKEIELIAFYKSDNRDYGYNIEHGGNCIGKISEETKQKQSEARKGEKCYAYGKHFSEEHKKKISDAHKGKFVSIETRERMRKARVGVSNEKNKKPICQYSLDGLLIKMWDCARNAAKALNVNSSFLTACCKGRQKTAYGYIWRYA